MTDEQRAAFQDLVLLDQVAKVLDRKAEQAYCRPFRNPKAGSIGAVACDVRDELDQTLDRILKLYGL